MRHFSTLERIGHALPAALQTISVAHSIPSGIAFYAGRFVSVRAGRNICETIFQNISKVAESLRNRVAGNHPSIRWTAPVAAMAAVSIISLKLYRAPTTLTGALVAGAVCGIHNYVMTRLAMARDDSLRDSLFEVFVLDTPLMNNYNAQREQAIRKISGIAHSVALLVSSVTLTIFLKNPIRANAIAHPLSAVIEVAAQRVLRELAA